MAAFGPYAAILALNGTTELTIDFLPAAAILVSLYFFISRALFYFSLLIRDKLESAEKILILRWEIISYLLTLCGAALVVPALGAAGAGRLAGRGAGAGRDWAARSGRSSTRPSERKT